MRFRKPALALLYLFLSASSVYTQLSTAEDAVPNNIESIKKADRILILAPHPDDEAIGCGGVIQEAVRLGAQVRIVYLTNGDHNQVAFIVYEKRLTLKTGEFIHMGEVRRQEAINAMRILGVDASNLIFLGYPDFGTFTIFREFWQGAKPFKGLLTRISNVPYKENFSYAAPYKGESILADLEKILKDYKPNKIFVSHPADTNSDHRAFYLFLQVALADLHKEVPQPRIYPYLIHCLGWPLPRHYHPDLKLLPPRQFLDSSVQWSQYPLSEEQLRKKYQATLCYKSQTESSAFYLLSFIRKDELFGGYPFIELDRQASAANAIPFSDYSQMFSDGGPREPEYPDRLLADKGRVSYAILDDSLLIRVDKRKELHNRLSLLIYLFGYSDKVPFAKMPKIRIVTRHEKFRVFDGRKMIKPEGMALELSEQELILKVPLNILGEPDFVLTAIKAYGGALPLDTMGLRKIIVR